MDFSQLIALTDSYKVFLIDINKAVDLVTETWTQDGVHTNCWYVAAPTSFEGVVNKVEEDGDGLAERFTLAECDGNAGSFLYDHPNQTLYVHVSGSDDPANYDAIIAYIFTHITNSQFDDEPVIYPRLQEALLDGGLEVWDSATALADWTESVGGASTVNRETGSHSGGFCVRFDIDAPGNNARIYQNIILPPRAKCKVSLWYKHSGGGVTSELQIKDTGNNVYLNSSANWQAAGITITMPNATAWTYFELEFYAHRTYTNYEFRVYGTDASTSNYFDAMSVTVYREDNYYLPYLESSVLPPIDQSVGDYYDSSMRMTFGQLRFLNDGWWYTQLQDYLYHNKDLVIRLNQKGSPIEDFQEIFSGKAKEPRVDDLAAVLETTDKRVMGYREVPINKYWTSNYPNLEVGANGLSIPILYGLKENILPTSIDTVAFKYKIADHQLQSIDAVYKDEVALTGGGVDYTADLPNGEFTLQADPGDSIITCDAKGRLCNMLDGTYSTNIGDILLDFIVNYVGVSRYDIDYESFLDLRAGRSQDHCLYLKLGQSANEIIRLFQRSALFHVIQTLDGKIGAFRYKTAVPTDTPKVRDEDYKGVFQCVYQTASVYKKIKVKYDQDPADESWETSVRTESLAEYRYKEEDTLNVDTTLKLEADADNLGDFYKDLYKDPQRKISIDIPTIGFNFIPSRKLIVSKTRTAHDGSVVQVFNEETFRILELKKNLSNKRVGIVALEDLQSVGESFCAVCFNCESCFTEEGGACSVCYACENCDSGQCENCQSCYYCEKCDAGECASCQACDSCEKCDAVCQAAECAVCASCEKCDTCQNCDSCETCDTCECSECASCQNCNTCEKCDTGECASCQDCNTCQTCDSGQCGACMVCDSCEACVACQKCDAGECSTCMLCDGCQKCDTCQKCDAGECTSCEKCNNCEKCDSGQCTTCMECDSCDACFTCESCDECENCITTEF